MTVRLDHVVIAVSDRRRSDVFYRDVLGAEVVERDGRAFYRVGDQQLNVHAARVSPAAVVGPSGCAGSGDEHLLPRPPMGACSS